MPTVFAAQEPGIRELFPQAAAEADRLAAIRRARSASRSNSPEAQRERETAALKEAAEAVSLLEASKKKAEVNTHCVSAAGWVAVSTSWI